MNRAKHNRVVLQMLLAVMMLAVLCGVSVAQTSARNAKAALTAKLAQKQRGVTAAKHQFLSPTAPALPAGIAVRQFNPNAQTKGVSKPNLLWAGKPKTRAPGDQSVTRQTLLLSTASPNTQYSETPATALTEHPYWTASGNYIYFDSNRVSQTDSTPRADGIFNLFYELPDGTGVVQVQTSAQNQIEPTVSTDGGQLAYVAGGTMAFSGGTSGLATLTTSGFTLYTQSVNGGGNVTQWTNNSPQFNFADVRHPSWAPGGNAIAFAGKLQGATVYHIFTVNVQSGTISQLTGGPSNDYAPACSPDGNLIAFATNAKSFTGNIAPTLSGATVANDDIYTVNVNPLTVFASRVTNFAANGVQSSNRNPAWSSTGIDPLNLIPPETTSNGSSLPQAQEMIAFASNRQDTNHDGVANSVGTTTDIYWLHTRIQAVQNGVYAVTTPETMGNPGNPAHKLQTSEPDTAINVPPTTPADPSYNFDPNFISNEDAPTWPMYQNSYRIVFQSDKVFNGGKLELWGSMILDFTAPTLLKYDIANNEIVHVALDSAPNTAVRQVNAGSLVRFRVRAVDYQSGVETVYLQIKCPDSAEQSADSTEHKIFAAENGVALMTSTDAIVNAPYEFDAQAVDPYSSNTNGNVRFKAAGVNSTAFCPLLNTWPGANLYTPGVEDIVAFSGGANPPDEPNYVPFGAPAGTPPAAPKDGQGGFWLRLYDDGPISKGGHEPEGETAGDGVYTAVWQTPPGFPSDWLLDVIVRDMAINPFDTGQFINWKIYDNVWGFSTKPFQSKSNLLYVSDYDTGQKFLNGRFGTFGVAGAQNGTNVLGTTFSGTPTESWMTEFDPNLFPTQYVVLTSGKTFPLANFQTSLGANSYTDSLDNDGTPIPPTQRYDIWRIQCRGPLPQNILNIYAPHTQTQAYNPVTGTTPPPYWWRSAASSGTRPTLATCSLVPAPCWTRTYRPSWPPSCKTAVD